MDRDEAARVIQELFESWYSFLLRYGLRLRAERSEVEDSIQDTMMLLYRNLCKGTKVPNPKAWTLLVFKRVLLRRMKVQNKYVSINEECPLNTDPRPASFGTGQDARLESRLLELLSPREAEVLLLRLQALKYREIGEALRISPNSVNKLLSRAAQKLRAWRKAVGGPPDPWIFPERDEDDCPTTTLQ